MSTGKIKTVSEIYQNIIEVFSNPGDEPSFDRIIDAIDEPIEHWRNSLVVKLGDKLDAWEEVHGKDDSSLYTLGLRHAIVLISEHDPVSESKEED
jgi:hypothetical protein